ncbi:MAG: hypothetical protein LC793_05915 [Thermomicrobia bacterium]|nr:hypothetical protein [Thermomicrobia bacterium]
MGSDTFFNGGFTITPPVPAHLIEQFNDRDEQGRISYVLRYDPWEISDNGTAILVPPDGERAYDADENLVRLVADLAALGHTVNGECDAECTEETSFWRYYVKGNVVLLAEGYRSYADPVPIRVEATP